MASGSRSAEIATWIPRRWTKQVQNHQEPQIQQPTRYTGGYCKSFHLPVLGSGSSSASCGQEVPTVSTQDLQCIAIGSLNFPDSLQAGMSPYILNTQEPTVHNPPKEYMAQQSYAPTMQACSVDRDTPQPSPTMHPCREEECSQYDCLRLRRRSQDSMQPSSASADLPSWPQECCSLLL